jgi:hypothetical protein
VLPANVAYVLALTDLNIRSGPGTNYSVIGSVFGGQIAQVTGVTADGSWWRVICPDSTVGSCFIIADPALTQPTNPPGNQPTPTSTPISQTAPERIQFAAGSTTATRQGTVQFPTRKSYVFAALAGQPIHIELISSDASANFSLVGLGDSQPLKRLENSDTVWSGTLPLNQDYQLQIATPSNAPVSYELLVEILPLNAGGTTERIRFAPGATAATVYGSTSAIEPKRYVLEAGGGQTMSVALNVDNLNAYITVLNPNGENMAGADGPIHTWTGVLPFNGDYVIEVLNPGTGLANFDLTVTIQ